MKSRCIVATLTVIGALLLVSGCSSDSEADSSDEAILATTTSTQDSGLLDELVPEFEEEFDCTIKTVAVGSGEALEMGEKGDADVLLVHSPDAEEEFMAGGHGLTRDAGDAQRLRDRGTRGRPGGRQSRRPTPRTRWPGSPTRRRRSRRAATTPGRTPRS